MNLQLKNALVFLDLETTGMNIASDRIVEIALLKINPNGDEEEKGNVYQSRNSDS
jgi:DNA polymerase III subunit epsilon